jgi:hypothetical protein
VVHFLYPSSPLKARLPDEQYAPEVECVREAGFEVSCFSLEAFQGGEFRAIPALTASITVLYRGWMLTAPEYERLNTEIEKADAHLFTTIQAYLECHHLPNWYPKLAELTPETRIFEVNSDLENELKKLGWEEFFIKDYVKSLKTASGSKISKPEQIKEMVENMRRFRGQIEGGFCVRQVEEFLSESERRYFVLNHTPYGTESDIPEIVRVCAERIDSRFFSVDVVRRRDGADRIVEVGDGQVSDTVGWSTKRFAEILSKEFGKASLTS